MYVGSGNNDKLIRDYFRERKGDFALMDLSEKYNNSYNFKWVQNISEIDYFSFKQDGSQLVCHIPNFM